MPQTATLRFDLDLRESLGRRLQPDGIVVQEDKNLLLAQEVASELDPSDPDDAAYLAVVAQRPLPAGRYLLLRRREGTSFWTYQAVVHDFDMTPTCRPGDVRRSLVAIGRDAVVRGFQHLALEPLGTFRTSGLNVEEMVDAFDEAAVELSVNLSAPLRLTLLLEEMARLEQVSHLLRSHVLRRASRRLRTEDGEAVVVEVIQGSVRLHYRFVPGSLSGYIVTRVDQVA